MNKKRIVVALGGNALGKDAKEQLTLVKKTANTIVDLIEQGHEVIIGHGNGPQVGMINLAMGEYCTQRDIPITPFPECGAMSQGYIGYHLQQSILNELSVRNIKKNVVTLITQTIVDKNDPAFENPTKPIGPFYIKEDAEKIKAKQGYIFMEDAGRGYRRVVPSPEPLKIVESDTINTLLKAGTVVITVGGGGIPVTADNFVLTGTSAVIDKDKSCAVLADSIKADIFLILTAVDEIYIDFNTANQRPISKVNLDDAIKYCKEGHFAKGSMLPKVEACIKFIKQRPESIAIITSLEKAKYALTGDIGTIIYNERNAVNIDD